MINIENYEALLHERSMQKKFSYDSTAILTFLAEYPQIELHRGPGIQGRINLYYRSAAASFYRYAAGPLRRDAVLSYRDAQENGYPFRPFDAVMKYTVTMNEACHLSTYFDRYEYTGGAHGNTRRFSASWDLRTGQKLSLADLFPRGVNVRRRVLEQVLRQADANAAENPNLYFDDYRDLITRYFNPDSFNLTPDALLLYYQQYEIGPYSSGILTFEIPYGELDIACPDCGRLHILR